MSDQRSTGPVYTGKHRRATSLGLAGLPGPGGRTGTYRPGRPLSESGPGADGIQAAGAVIPGPWRQAGLSPGTGPWPDAG